MSLGAWQAHAEPVDAPERDPRVSPRVGDIVAHSSQREVVSVADNWIRYRGTMGVQQGCSRKDWINWCAGGRVVRAQHNTEKR